MKRVKFILLLCATISYLSTSAQLEFAPIGAKWYVNEDYCSINEPFRFDEYEIIECTGDTLINNKFCKVVGDDIIHQNGEKIYHWYIDSFYLIYDFGVEIGDTVVFDLISCEQQIQPVPFYIDTIKCIPAGDTCLRQFTAVPTDQASNWLWFESGNYVYYEKFGSEGRLVEDELCESFIVCYEPSFLRCYEDEDIYIKTDYWTSLGDWDCDDGELISSIPRLSNDIQLEVYPNPTSEVLRISTSNKSLSGEYVFQIIDVRGQVIVDLSKNINSDFNITISIGDVPKGVYFLTVFTDKKLISSRTVSVFRD